MLSFKQFIAESPYMEFGDSKQFVKKQTDDLRNILQSSHDSAEHIGKSDEGDYYKNKLGSRTAYYHHVNNAPREISVVDNNNTQCVLSKGDGGDVKHNNWLVKHHAKNHGEVNSYYSNTKGSKSFWKNLSKENDPNFSVYHHDGTNEHKVDSSYIDNNENVIWDKSEKAKKHILSIKPNV